ncbi:serine aminopeptidase domain-containing protein [Ancylobacter sp. TS-1]|uniref:serine aminopeptidase domain-containing protein n=1 Tax=Ancylobacter sp. TS-1 TaxID=1850374 RepID=UPI001265AF25|nr:alpha/beta hydrolase [Ancylobacter sp. TS-1]QFR32938.1 prolyl oligopeptidase family serine peptidase [Ancylobacter sp. TS-1]
MAFLFRALALCLLAIAASAPARAQEKGAVAVPGGISYEFLERWDVDRLNTVLKTETPAFAGVAVDYTPARNAVRLYRVTYPSVIPERGNRPTTATGLLAIPDLPGTSFPMVSYQHGTVYGKQQVPSFIAQSTETALMVAQFAGQGYVVVGADYFGLGLSTEPEGYMVKAAHQQATADMVTASRQVLAAMKLSTPKLFLAGWSQGGFVTMALLEKLEADGIAVNAAATASAPVDIFVALSGFLDFPRPNDASWVTTLFILSSFSFENYYGVPGLARSLIADAYYEVARKAYAREPFDAANIPTDLRKLIRPDYFDPHFFAASAYGRLVAATNAYRWIIRTPVRNYYGEKDEVISIGLGQLAQTYQRAIGAGNPAVEAISTGETTHRGTFATAVPQWKAWFDGK